MMEVRLLTDDKYIPALVALMNECQPHFNREVESVRRWFFINQHRINMFGVFDSNALIGYAATEPAGEAFIFAEGGVSRDRRSQGIASDTISEVSRYYWDQGFRIARILTQKKYVRQQLLYQRLGFEIQGYVKNNKGTMDCWMIKHLTEDNL